MGAGKAVGEDAALQIPLERFAHEGLGFAMACPSGLGYPRGAAILSAGPLQL